MSSRTARALACFLVAGLALEAPAAVAQGVRARHAACVARCPVVPMARRHWARVVPRRHSRTGWRPVIRPFDQAEAEAYVHEIAPYRTYPFYPLIPAVEPQPDVFGW